MLIMQKIIQNLLKLKKIKLKPLKFQFRELKTFVHKNELNNKKNKYVDRFLSTKLSMMLLKLLNYVRKKGFLSSCTPF